MVVPLMTEQVFAQTTVPSAAITITTTQPSGGSNANASGTNATGTAGGVKWPSGPPPCIVYGEVVLQDDNACVRRLFYLFHCLVVFGSNAEWHAVLVAIPFIRQCHFSPYPGVFFHSNIVKRWQFNHISYYYAVVSH